MNKVIAKDIKLSFTGEYKYLKISADFVVDGWTGETIRKDIQYGINFNEYTNELLLVALELGALEDGDELDFDVSYPMFRYNEDTNQLLTIHSINGIYICDLIVRDQLENRIGPKRRHNLY